MNRNEMKRNEKLKARFPSLFEPKKCCTKSAKIYKCECVCLCVSEQISLSLSLSLTLTPHIHTLSHLPKLIPFRWYCCFHIVIVVVVVVVSITAAAAVAAVIQVALVFCILRTRSYIVQKNKTVAERKKVVKKF